MDTASVITEVDTPHWNDPRFSLSSSASPAPSGASLRTCENCRDPRGFSVALQATGDGLICGRCGHHQSND